LVIAVTRSWQVVLRCHSPTMGEAGDDLAELPVAAVVLVVV
jgi:hypothetical protein